MIASRILSPVASPIVHAADLRAPTIPAPGESLGAASLGWMTASRDSLQTIVGGAVDVLADATPGSSLTWTAPTAGRRPTRTTLLGRPAFGLSTAANSALITTSGGVTGADPCTGWTLCQITGNPATAESVSMLGRLAATHVLAGMWTNTLWTGGTGHAQPQGTLPVGAHMILRTYDGNNITTYVDGVYHSSSAHVFNVQSGSGLGAWQGTSVATSIVAEAGFASGVIARALGSVGWEIERWIASVYGYLAPRRIVCLGTSITLGATTTPWPTQLQTALTASAATVYNKGNGGNTAAQLLALVPAQVAVYPSPLVPQTALVLENATNSLITAAGSDPEVIAAAIWADTANTIAAARAAGVSRIVLCTTLPSVLITAGAKEDARQLLLTRQRAAARGDITVADIAAIPEMGNTGDATYYYDGTHPTTAGNALIAARVQEAL